MKLEDNSIFLSQPKMAVLLILFLTVVPIALIFSYYYFNTQLYPGRDKTLDGLIIVLVLSFINLGIILFKNSRNNSNDPSSNNYAKQPWVTTKQYLMMFLILVPLAIGMALVSNFIYFYLMETYNWHHNTTFKFVTSCVSGMIWGVTIVLIIVAMTKYFDKRNKEQESKTSD